MAEALREARKAEEEGEIPIGAVVVSRGRIIGSGHNMTERLHDATAHAEMIAITAATESLGAKYLTDCTLYVTVEPCPMCAGTSTNPYTVAQARAFIDGLNGATSTEKYVSGIISQIDNYNSNNSSITYWISDCIDTVLHSVPGGRTRRPGAGRGRRTNRLRAPRKRSAPTRPACLPPR